MKVDFLIAGTQKGGTTTLDAYLRNHPDIRMARKKEVHFFDNDRFFDSETPDYDLYHSHFPIDRRAPNVLYGEATPIYMYWREAPGRIHRYNPGMKLIILLRNPIERAYSHWNMQRDREIDTATFLEALHSEAIRCRAAWPSQERHFSYVDRGHYVDQLERIYGYFPKDQVLVLRSNDLETAPSRALDRTCDFLCIPRLQVNDSLHLHARAYPSPIGPKEWAYLRELFEREVSALEALTGWDCSDWLQPPASVAA